MMMRVLCLHPAASSARRLSAQLAKLERRLREKHSIELVFADAPLLDATPPCAVVVDAVANGDVDVDVDADDADVDDDVDDGCRVSRRWYVEESSSSPSSPLSSPPVRFSGLDASLLHLSQLWNRIGGFHGVLGVGQGADVAALLPMLDRHRDGDGDDDYDDDDNDNDEDEDDDDDNDANEICQRGPSMFPGLRFVVLVDGRDILRLGDEDDGDDGSTVDAAASASAADRDDDDDVRVGPGGVRSLHVLSPRTTPNGDGTVGRRRRRDGGERLARVYGPNATMHRCRQRSAASSSPDDDDAPTTTTPPSSAELSNAVGKFLVSMKNGMRSDPTERQLAALRGRLSDVERVATLALSEEIRRNPPKALMAVIGPAVSAIATTGEDEYGGGEEDLGGGEVLPSPTSVVEEGGGGGRECDDDYVNDDCPSAGAGAGAGGGDVGTTTKTMTTTTTKVVVDKVVGAWRGGRRREFDEDGGGAPCPEEFLLREVERR
jgi:hypothetical protein